MIIYLQTEKYLCMMFSLPSPLFFEMIFLNCKTVLNKYKFIITNININLIIF